MSISIPSCVARAQRPSVPRKHSPRGPSRRASLAALFAASALLSCTDASQPGKDTGNDSASAVRQARVYFIRHAHSCSNALPLGAPGPADPALTHCGLYRSRAVGQYFADYLASENIELDFIGASTLTRTKETMLMMFYPDFFVHSEGASLYEVPYVGETPFSHTLPSNRPGEFSEELANITRWFPALQSAQLSNQFTADLSAWDREEVSYEHFRDQTLPQILDTLEGDPMHLAIASHSVTMWSQMNCNHDGVLPTNNEVFAIDYEVKNGVITHESECVNVVRVEPGKLGKGWDTADADNCADPHAGPSPFNDDVSLEELTNHVTHACLDVTCALQGQQLTSCASRPGD